MSTPAQVTDAHRILLRKIYLSELSIDEDAQLIADSEAKAVQGQNAVIAEWLNRVAVVSAERDQLRKERDMWKANHDNMVELKGIIASRPDLGDRAPRVAALIAERDRLRAQVALDERVKASMLREHHDAKDRAEKAESDARRERITWEAVDERNRDLAKSLTESEAELVEAKDTIGSLSRDRSAAMEELAALLKRAEKAEAELANANARAAEWARIVDDRNAQLATLRALLADLRSPIICYGAHSASAQDHLDEIDKALAASATDQPKRSMGELNEIALEAFYEAAPGYSPHREGVAAAVTAVLAALNEQPKTEDTK